jgi:PAS domain S-box-containing protein
MKGSQKSSRKKPAATRRVPRVVHALENRLREAEETLDAIRMGHVDALVVQGPRGDQVFTLEGADHRFRQLVETMNEGALLVGGDGTIMYGNARFATMVGVPLERMIGTAMQLYVTEASRRLLDALLQTRGDGEPQRAEAELEASDGSRVPVYLSATAGWTDEVAMTCVIVTDLRDQKRNRAMLAAEQLTARIVDQAAEAIVVCDPTRMIVRASNAAHRLAGGNPLLRSFEDVFVLRAGESHEFATELVERTLRGETTTGHEALLDGDRRIDLLVSAAPVAKPDGEILGCVISFVDITDRKRAAEERIALLAAAESANRSKDEFLAMLGHELRNPLAPIMTALDLMNMRPDETFRRERDIIERQVKHVVMLVGDLLDVSRIAQGKIDLDRGPVDLASVVERAIEAASPLVEERRHTVELDVPANLWVDGDEGRLRQVVSNLVTNAAKYTPRGGRIDIVAAQAHDTVVLRVRDTGAGIAPELLPNLFDLFVQGKRTLDRAQGGLGLGLAIVRSLVALHGGTVEARSAGLGHGSEFEVRLPACPAPVK